MTVEGAKLLYTSAISRNRSLLNPNHYRVSTLSSGNTRVPITVTSYIQKLAIKPFFSNQTILNTLLCKSEATGIWTHMHLLR